MTDKQLRRLSKLELLDILIAQDRELETLRTRNADLEKRMLLLRDIFEKYMKTKKPEAPKAVQADAPEEPVEAVTGEMPAAGVKPVQEETV